MTIKQLKNRWSESQENHSAYIKILKRLKRGGILKKQYSPFGTTENDYTDFRGLDLSKRLIKKIRVENADFSHSNFYGAWIEKATFINVIFNKVDFTEITDKGNQFNKVEFLNCKFNRAGMGYNGSQFIDCLIENSSFIRTAFTRNEFINTQFKNNNLKEVDFNASSFDNCTFVGKLEDVWFRGGYPLSSDIKMFGKAKKNIMKNVSFEKAILKGVDFTNDCDLSTIKLPLTGNYLIYKKWDYKLEVLKNKIIEFPENQRKEAKIFVDSELVHSKTQDSSLLNIDDLRQEFGVDLANNILDVLNEE